MWDTFRRTLRFLLVGTVNTAFTLILIVLIQNLTPASPYVANAVGYVAGMALSFYLNGRWTFSESKLQAAHAGRFIVAFLVSYGVNLAALTVLIASGVTADLAQVLSAPFYTLIFFVLCRVMVFPAAPNKT